ncbi:MAG TPA: ParB N-terminal domain-containing protein [Phycisphaerae bacterium]|nr:ParB N-terminal domain-containing protein [Phycisphaerae bacterium]HQL73934.1 ParB N-terminal domain-containing protein [Phycisphaerae bacterium]
MKLPLKKIRLDGGTQTRARIHNDILDEYAEDMKAGSPFPPLIVFHDGRDYWLGDGFHRWGAAAQLGLDSIECEIRQGTMADAQWYSFSANKTNGMRRTNDDKVRAVKSALRHCKGERSNIEIARHVGVDDHTVAKYRQELVAAGESIAAAISSRASSEIPKMRQESSPGEPARVVTRKGKTYQMKVGRIGKAKKPGRKSGGIAKDAAVPFRKPGQMIPTLTISIPLNNPDAAAGALLSNCEPSYLRAMVDRITTVLDERGAA